MLETLSLMLPPGVLLIVAALLLPLLPRGLQGAWAVLAAVAGLLQMILLPEGHQISTQLFGLELMPVNADGLGRFFGLVFALAAVLCTLYAAHLRDGLQGAAALAYAGSGVGAVLAGDLITLFVYWELTALTSVFLIWARRSETAYAIGMRYLLIQVLSGVILFSGVALMLANGEGARFEWIGLGTTAGWLILLAFGIKAAFPLLHNWLHDAYPGATPVGTVFMSCFTTKLAIYALMRGFAAEEALIWIGTVMAVFTVFYALIEDNIRRIVTYALQTQLGLIVIGIGLGTPLALDGAAAHAAMGVFYVALLLMGLGVVVHRTGTSRASELGGLAGRMPVVTGLTLLGAAALSALPLTNGYISKSLIFSAAASEGFTLPWLAMLFASVGMVLAIGIRLPWLVFFGRPGTAPDQAGTPRNTVVAMALTALVCLVAGLLPALVYGLLPYGSEYAPYTGEKILNQLQLMVFAALAVVILLRLGRFPVTTPGRALETDWFYRVAAPSLIGGVHRHGTTAWHAVLATLRWPINRVIRTAAHHHGPQGTLARTWPTGSMVLWVAVMLAASLLIYYL